jgi:hypothetical protein
MPLAADIAENHKSGAKQREINALYWNGRITAVKYGIIVNLRTSTALRGSGTR